MKDSTIIIGRWHYRYEKPPRDTGTDGVVILSRHSVAPAEIYKWGVDAQNRPFERYNWCEDDLYKDSSACKSITKEELLRQLEDAALLFRKNGYEAPAATLDAIRMQLAVDL